MKNVLKLSILLGGMCAVTAVHAGGERMQGWGFAPETDFYAGAGIGAANQRAFDEGNSGAGKIFAGVRYRGVGAEVGYLGMGEVEDPGSMPRDPTFKSDARAFSVSAVGYMPVAARTELMGKVGAVYWDKDNTNEVALTGVNDESDDSGLSPMLGVGAQYKLYQNMQLRGEWEHIFSTGEGDYESDIDVLSVGVSVSTY
ncbi:MAG: outer membrane beta-barrel protein [Thiolinea sp.]